MFAVFVIFPLVAQDAEFYYKRGLEYLGNSETERAIEDFSRAISINPTNASYWLNKGLAHEEKGEFSLAIQDYTVCIALAPENFFHWSLRGDVYCRKAELDFSIEDYHKAIRDYEKAIELKSDFAAFWSSRGFAYHAIGEHELAKEDFNKALDLDPDLVSFSIDEGIEYQNNGDLNRAIDIYTKALIIAPKNFHAWYNRGMAYYTKGEMDLAISDLNEAVTLDPDNTSAYHERGRAYQSKTFWDLAIKDYSKVISKEPSLDYVWFNRGMAYFARGDLDWAIEDYSKAIEINPGNVGAYVSRGIAYYNLNYLDKVIEDLNNAVALNAEDADIWFKRGFAYYKLGQYDEAIEDFSKAMDLIPNNDDLWYFRGAAYAQKKETDHAINDYNKALELNPANASALCDRGIIFLQRNNFTQAIADFNKALEIESYSSTLFYRGLAYSNTGELDKAIEDFSHAISIEPDFYWALVYRGMAHSRQGKNNQAIEDLSSANSKAPHVNDALIARGIVYAEIDEPELAINDLSRAIDMDPDNYYAWLNLGNVFRGKNDPDKAIESYDKAIGINPNNTFAWVRKGEACFDKGEYDLAIKHYDKAVSIDPNNGYALYKRGIAYEKKGDTPKAIDDYRESIEAAEKSVDIQNIFSQSWEFAGSLCSRYPFLDGKIINNEFDRQYANLALDALGRSIARAEKARASLGSRGAEIMTGLIYQYYAGVDFEINFGSVNTAFAYSERLRSRGFLEQMATEDALKLPGINPADAQRVRELSREITNFQMLLSTLNSITEAERYAEAGASLTKAEAELAVIDAKIGKKVPGYAEFRNPSPIEITQAKTFCKNNDLAVLQYILWDSSIEFKAPVSTYGQSKYRERPSINSYCLVLTRDGVTPVRLDSDFDYAGKTETFNAIVGKSQGLFNTRRSREAFETGSSALYSKLIKPVLKHIEGIKNILIVPDGNLAFLPFDVLRENPSSPYLGEQFSITLSPSVSVSVAARQKEISVNEPILAFGGAWYSKDQNKNNPPEGGIMDIDNYLAVLDSRLMENRGITFAEDFDEEQPEKPAEKQRAADYFNVKGGWGYLAGTVAEVEGLKKITTIEPTIFRGKDVNKRFVKRLSLEGTLLNYPIIHFACHGYFNDNLIPQAALVFSEVSGLIGDISREDGYLSIDEVALLQLNARMVMLSACQTGLGQIKRGDGMSGLARAFMTAGAQNVGVSLWEISDEATADFMSGVYRKVIREGKTFRDAYSEMKGEFRKSEKWSHPYYWAGFTLYE